MKQKSDGLVHFDGPFEDIEAFFHWMEVANNQSLTKKPEEVTCEVCVLALDQGPKMNPRVRRVRES